MAHEVESMMYVGNTPWHGLGIAIPDRKKLSIEEAIVAAGLGWEVELRPIFTEDGDGSPHGILNHYVTCRKTDNTVLGIVGKDYKPLQNRDAFRWFQPFLDSGEATLDTAGSLKWGSRVSETSSHLGLLIDNHQFYPVRCFFYYTEASIFNSQFKGPACDFS